MTLQKRISQMPWFARRRWLTVVVCRAVTCIVALLAAGCAVLPSKSHILRSENSRENGVYTNRVLSKVEIRQLAPKVVLGDESYAEVNSVWLKEWHKKFRSELLRMGISRWNKQFDCNRFADAYTGLAQIEFYRETYHNSTKAQALAIGPYWYVTRNGKSHAIVQAFTERGRVFIEPQSGMEITLTTKEQGSSFLQVF